MEQELVLLDEAIARKPSGDLYLERGRLLWRLQRYGAAIADYEKAVALDGPGSPAAAALQLAREVMAFYHRDMYNP